ncbi:MAG TPA: cytochrome-c peroxidase, partial [Segetibacter sp.]
MKRFSRKFRFLFFLLLTVATASLLMSNKPQTKTTKAIASYYASELQVLEKAVLQMEVSAESATIDQLRQLFMGARFSYKRIEWLIEYHFPATAVKMNGPALLETEPSEPAEALHPSGFQVLEEKLYKEEADQLRKEILFEISSIVNRIHHLQALVPEIELTESNILDALKLHLYRIITKGITGFDSPVAGNSIAELQPSLGGIKTALAFFKDTKPLIKNIDAAMAYVKQGGNDFNAFNRAVFIAQYLNPISTALNSYQKKQRIPFTQEERALRPDANTLFEASAWQPLFYAPSGTSKATARQIALGKKLFAEPLLSANGKRSCASCHNPQKAFTDGLALNVTLSGSGMLLRNTPTLYNASLQSAQFYDSRISFLEDQIHDVVSNQQEMNGQFASIVKVLEQKNSYKQLFCAAFADKNISADNIRAAVAAYVRSLVLLNSPFDQFMRGNRKGMNAEQV